MLNAWLSSPCMRNAVMISLETHYMMKWFQVLLGLSGVVLVMLSVLGSVGFFSAVGVKSTLIIMEVIPFLVLAVSSVLAANVVLVLYFFQWSCI